MELAHMLVKNDATAEQRKAVVLKMSRVISRMQGHPEAKALARIAAGGVPTATWFVQQTLQVDAYVLDCLKREPLKREWFFEQRDGNCRLMGSFAARLAKLRPCGVNLLLYMPSGLSMHFRQSV